MIPFFCFYIYNLFMVKKQIQKHNFLSGGPEIQYSLNFNFEDQDTIGVAGENHFAFRTTQINPQFSMVDINGNDIFVVTEEQIRWRGADLVTEERLREIIEDRVEQRIRDLGLI